MNPNDLPPAPAPDDPIDLNGADYLLIWANQIDARIQSTDANAEVWAYQLAGKRYEICQTIIADYYGTGGERGEMDPVTLGHIKREYRRREAVREAKEDGAQRQHQIEAGTYGRRKSRVPRWFIEKGQREWGAFKDRDPNDYD